MEQQYVYGALKSRKLFDTLTQLGYFSLCSDFSNVIVKAAEEYYANDPDASEVDLEILGEALARKVPRKADLFKDHLKKIPPKEELSIPNLAQDAIKAKMHSLREHLGNAAYSHDEETLESLWAELAECKRLLTDNNNKEEEGEGLFNSITPSDIRTTVDPSARLRLYPLAMNELLNGGALRGHHLLVFARPDGGKTTFTINLCRGFLKDGRKVLYVANEEPPAAILQRLIQSIFAWTSKEFLEKDLDQEKLEQAGYNNFYLYHNDAISITTVEQLAEKIKPDVIIIDQLRNIEGPKTKDSNKVLALEEAARGVRKLGLRFDCLTISITQAGDSASNKLILEQNDVDFSNTGIPGAVDLMIGIGFNQQWMQQGKRMLSFPKNKLGDPVGAFPVTFNTAVVRVK